MLQVEAEKREMGRKQKGWGGEEKRKKDRREMAGPRHVLIEKERHVRITGSQEASKGFNRPFIA
jgi:hypothetical protein